MERYKACLDKLQKTIPGDECDDGFPSGLLRRKILLKIAAAPLPENADEYSNFFRPLNREERIRMKYLADSAKIGEKVFLDAIENQLPEPRTGYLPEIRRQGAIIFGHAIGRAYASALYAEKRRLRDHKVKLPALELSSVLDLEKCNYEFTVIRYMAYFNITPVTETNMPLGSDITYDDINECYREHFVFSSLEEADAQIDLWEKYLMREIPAAPVKYGFELENDPLAVAPVSGVFHVNSKTTPFSSSLPAELRPELRVFDTLQAAISAREDALKEKPKPQNVSPAPEPFREYPAEIIRQEPKPRFTPVKPRNAPALGK